MHELDELVADASTFAYLQKYIFTVPQPEPWKPLHLAAILALTAWAEHLIDKGADPSEICRNRNALQAAALWRPERPAILKLLLKHGVDLNQAVGEPACAFHTYLFGNPTEEVVRLMLDNGADRNLVGTLKPGHDGWGALHYFATKGEDPKVLDLLLHYGASNKQPLLDINADNTNKEIPLHVLFHRKAVPRDLLEAFLEHGADPNTDSTWSSRPLHLASGWGDSQSVEVLLPHMTEIEDEDQDGATALHWACITGNLDCARLLIEKGKADPVKPNLRSRTPLYSAILFGWKELADYLLQVLKMRQVPIADINHYTKRKRTPLRQAAARGYTDIVKAILEMEELAKDKPIAAVHQADDLSGRNPLHCAAWAGHASIVRLLLQYGADPSVKDAEGKSPLTLSHEQWALCNDSLYEDTVCLLIDSDSQAAIDGSELLATAAINGSKSVLERLHKHGADLNRADKFGWTAITLAKQHNHSEAEHFLKQQTAWGGTLPSRWVNSDPDSEVELAEDGLGVILTNDDYRGCVSSNRPLPSGLNKFYYELTSTKLEGIEQPMFPAIAIGFCTLGAASYDFPGWPPKKTSPSGRSWALHGDDGGIYNGLHSPVKVDKYGPGDTVGCGVDLEKGIIWFTKNGKKLDGGFQDVRGRLFPIIGLYDPVKLETNFKGPFMWKEDHDGDEGEKTAISHDQGDKTLESDATAGSERKESE